MKSHLKNFTVVLIIVAAWIGFREWSADRERERTLELMREEARLEQERGPSTEQLLKSALLNRQVMETRALQAQRNPELAEQQRLADERQAREDAAKAAAAEQRLEAATREFEATERRHTYERVALIIGVSIIVASVVIAKAAFAAKSNRDSGRPKSNHRADGPLSDGR